MEDGWIEWKGGECPVGPRALVEVELRDGFKMKVPALDLTGAAIGEVSTPDNDNWLHNGTDDDIVRYREVPA